jgi:hypothetical protein
MISVSRAGVVISAKHISSTPNWESSSTKELQIGRAAAPELVWRSRSQSPSKHATYMTLCVTIFRLTPLPEDPRFAKDKKCTLTALSCVFRLGARQSPLGSILLGKGSLSCADYRGTRQRVYVVRFPRCTAKKETETADTNGTEVGFAVNQKMRTANGSYNKIKKLSPAPPLAPPQPDAAFATVGRHRRRQTRPLPC